MLTLVSYPPSPYFPFSSCFFEPLVYPAKLPPLRFPAFPPLSHTGASAPKSNHLLPSFPKVFPPHLDDAPRRTITGLHWSSPIFSKDLSSLCEWRRLPVFGKDALAFSIFSVPSIRPFCLDAVWRSGHLLS